MRVCLFFIFMVIHITTAEKEMSKLRRKLIVPKIDDKCRKIKCASVDQPECVKFRRNDRTFDIHIIVVNKCELDFLNCHDNVDAKIVPMKYCSHHDGELGSDKKILKNKVHSRVKRRVSPWKNNKDKGIKGEQDSSEKSEFGYYPHPIKDPWARDLWDKVPQELYIYLVMK